MRIKYIFRIFFVLFLLWVTGFVFFLLSIFQANEKSYSADAIMVLTGAYGRINDGIDLLKEDVANRMLISGVKKNINKNILFDKINYNISDKNLLDKITLETNSTTTIENIIEAKNWIHQHKIKSIILVTHYYHIPRSILNFKHIIKDVEVIPYKVFDKEVDQKIRLSYRNIFFEYHKYFIQFILNLIKIRDSNYGN